MNKDDLYRNQVARWIRRKKTAVEYKGGKCIDCGFTGHYAAYQFHHRDPYTKLYDWNKLRLHKWETVHAELDKCDLLCANCHSIRHALPT